MEPFVDFGLFELMAATGLAVLAKWVFARKALAIAVVLTSVAAPLTLLIVAASETGRWLAVVALATAIINATALLDVLRQRHGALRRSRNSMQ